MTNMMNATDQNSTEEIDPLDAISPESQNSNNITQYDEVFEERLTFQMASMTRIVNGEDCPPGECPWQVETIYMSNEKGETTRSHQSWPLFSIIQSICIKIWNNVEAKKEKAEVFQPTIHHWLNTEIWEFINVS